MKEMLRRLVEWFSTPAGRWVLITVCSIFMIGGALNNGMTKFALAIPFDVLFALQIRHVHRGWAGTFFVCMPLLSGYLAWDHPHSRFMYPVIGQQITLGDGWYSGRQEYSTYDYLWSPEIQFRESLDHPRRSSSGEVMYDYQSVEDFIAKSSEYDKYQPIPANFVLTFNGVETSWNEGSGTLRTAELQDNNGRAYRLHESTLRDGIKYGLLSPYKNTYDNGFQSWWSEYLGDLMMYPLLPFAIYGVIYEIIDF